MVDKVNFEVWQRQAEADGVGLVVGAMVVRDGKIFVHRRAYDRKLLPGCWDMVGGHVDEGEDMYEALVREVWEETQWRVSKVVALAHTLEWVKGDAPMREYVFLVEVEGDEEPVLEAGKVVEGWWVSEGETGKLLENRVAGDEVVKQFVEAGFRALRG